MKLVIDNKCIAYSTWQGEFVEGGPMAADVSLACAGQISDNTTSTTKNNNLGYYLPTRTPFFFLSSNTYPSKQTNKNGPQRDKNERTKPKSPVRKPLPRTYYYWYESP